MAVIQPEMVQKGDRKPIGRPPKLFQDDELDGLGQELFQWMVDNEKTDDIVHMSDWYQAVKHMTRSEWENLADRVGFSCYYDEFRDWMGRKIMKNKALKESYGNRMFGMYLSDVHEYEEGKADRQAERVKKNAQEVSPVVNVYIPDLTKPDSEQKFKKIDNDS